MNAWAMTPWDREAYLKQRKAYFKQVACDNHTWPIVGCEKCHDKMMDLLERQFDETQNAV
jgi:hypothetical protein